MGVAAMRALQELDGYQRVAMLRDAMEMRLRAISPTSRIYGSSAPRLPNTCCIDMPGVASELQVMSFDLDGIAVSAGSACSSGKVKASHVLTAMGVPLDLAGAALRISLGWSTTETDIERCLKSWEALFRRKSSASAIWTGASEKV